MSIPAAETTNARPGAVREDRSLDTFLRDITRLSRELSRDTFGPLTRKRQGRFLLMSSATILISAGIISFNEAEFLGLKGACITNQSVLPLLAAIVSTYFAALYLVSTLIDLRSYTDLTVPRIRKAHADAAKFAAAMSDRHKQQGGQTRERINGLEEQNKKLKAAELRQAAEVAALKAKRGVFSAETLGEDIQRLDELHARHRSEISAITGPTTPAALIEMRQDAEREAENRRRENAIDVAKARIIERLLTHHSRMNRVRNVLEAVVPQLVYVVALALAFNYLYHKGLPTFSQESKCTMEKETRN